MNRRKLAAPAVAVIALVPATTACQPVVDYFGPRPDATLVELAQAAEADAQALNTTDPENADLRQGQADALYAEVARLCGTRDGQVPESCEVEHATEATADGQTAPGEGAEDSVDSAAVLTRARDAVLGQLTAVTAESRPLVTDQAIDLSAAVNSLAAEAGAGADSESDPAPELAVDTLDPEQAEAARELLDWEYQQSFGLDFARAFAEPWLEPIIDARLDAHAHLTAQLQQALAATGDVPQPAAGYEPAGLELPTDAASAEQFVRSLRESNAETWRAAATEEAARLSGQSASTEWRDWLIAVAARS
ncbi:DUF4439 domain-containing protein [Corynebacterium sp. 32222D000AT]|uniref:DUF4439 domain-containing protein n=1 Tax=unclassified Corynebacterium TaxID=2624378 RepID=UPI002A92E27F|nr:DUF4439 domain-containing protein [Mycobacteriaceae bacterium]MDY5828521.1 DUF4439 domain-containing protein [Corynebacterium sp.]